MLYAASAGLRQKSTSPALFTIAIPRFPAIVSTEYRAGLDGHGIVASMSRRGDCWDNAVTESFFATLKGEWLDHDVYATRADAIAAIDDFINGFYNPQRRHSALGYLSPIEFELRLKSGREAA